MHSFLSYFINVNLIGFTALLLVGGIGCSHAQKELEQDGSRDAAIVTNCFDLSGSYRAHSMSLCRNQGRYEFKLGNKQFAYQIDPLEEHLKTLLRSSYGDVIIDPGRPGSDSDVHSRPIVGEVWLEPNLFEPDRAKIWLMFVKGSYRYGRPLEMGQIWSRSPKELRRWPLAAVPHRDSAEQPTLWYLEVGSQLKVDALGEFLELLGWQHQDGWPLALVKVPQHLSAAELTRHLENSPIGSALKTLEPVRSAALSPLSQPLFRLQIR